MKIAVALLLVLALSPTDSLYTRKLSRHRRSPLFNFGILKNYKPFSYFPGTFRIPYQRVVLLRTPHHPESSHFRVQHVEEPETSSYSALSTPVQTPVRDNGNILSPNVVKAVNIESLPLAHSTYSLPSVNYVNVPKDAFQPSKVPETVVEDFKAHSDSDVENFGVNIRDTNDMYAQPKPDIVEAGIVEEIPEDIITEIETFPETVSTEPEDLATNVDMYGVPPRSEQITNETPYVLRVPILLPQTSSDNIVLPTAATVRDMYSTKQKVRASLEETDEIQVIAPIVKSEISTDQDSLKINLNSVPKVHNSNVTQVYPAKDISTDKVNDIPIKSMKDTKSVDVLPSIPKVRKPVVIPILPNTDSDIQQQVNIEQSTDENVPDPSNNIKVSQNDFASEEIKTEQDRQRDTIDDNKEISKQQTSLFINNAAADKIQSHNSVVHKPHFQSSHTVLDPRTRVSTFQKTQLSNDRGYQSYTNQGIRFHPVRVIPTGFTPNVLLHSDSNRGTKFSSTQQSFNTGSPIELKNTLQSYQESNLQQPSVQVELSESGNLKEGAITKSTELSSNFNQIETNSSTDSVPVTENSDEGTITQEENQSDSTNSSVEKVNVPSGNEISNAGTVRKDQSVQLSGDSLINSVSSLLETSQIVKKESSITSEANEEIKPSDNNSNTRQENAFSEIQSTSPQLINRKRVKITKFKPFNDVSFSFSPDEIVGITTDGTDSIHSVIDSDFSFNFDPDEGIQGITSNGENDFDSIISGDTLFNFQPDEVVAGITSGGASEFTPFQHHTTNFFTGHGSVPYIGAPVSIIREKSEHVVPIYDEASYNSFDSSFSTPIVRYLPNFSSIPVNPKDNSHIADASQVAGFYIPPKYNANTENILQPGESAEASQNIDVSVLPGVLPRTYGAMGYRFNYNVDNEPTETAFSRYEKSDGETTHGQYSVVLPDGRTQVVKFFDEGLGFKADVHYLNE